MFQSLEEKEGRLASTEDERDIGQSSGPVQRAQLDQVKVRKGTRKEKVQAAGEEQVTGRPLLHIAVTQPPVTPKRARHPG